MLQENQDLVLNVMDVFLKDPISDWKRHMTYEVKGAGDAKGDIRAYATARLAQARKKLQNFNPICTLPRVHTPGRGQRSAPLICPRVCGFFGDRHHRARSEAQPASQVPSERSAGACSTMRTGEGRWSWFPAA